MIISKNITPPTIGQFPHSLPVSTNQRDAFFAEISSLGAPAATGVISCILLFCNFSNLLAKILTLGSCCFWEDVASALVVSCSSLFLWFLLFGEMLAHIFLLLSLLVPGFLFLVNLGFLIAAWWAMR
jgi:hypothetical protein